MHKPRLSQGKPVEQGRLSPALRENRRGEAVRPSAFRKNRWSGAVSPGSAQIPCVSGDEPTVGKYTELMELPNRWLHQFIAAFQLILREESGILWFGFMDVFLQSFIHKPETPWAQSEGRLCALSRFDTSSDRARYCISPAREGVCRLQKSNRERPFCEGILPRP